MHLFAKEWCKYTEQIPKGGALLSTCSPAAICKTSLLVWALHSPAAFKPSFWQFCCQGLKAKLFATLQCAWFFLKAFPLHCDCLALANVLAFQLKREDSFDKTGSGSHKHTNSVGGSNSGSGIAESQVEKAMQSDDAPHSGSHSNSSCK